MNYYAFSALVAFLSAVASGLFVFWKNPRGRKNRTYLPFSIAVASWAIFYMLWQMATNEQDALLFIRMSIACAVFIPVTNFHTILVVLDAETPRRQIFLKWMYIISCLLVLFAPTPYFIPRVEPRLGFPFWPVPGLTMHIHMINLFLPSLWTLYLIREKGEKSTPLARNKLKWLMVSYLIAYAGGMSNNFLWYNIPVKPILNILVPVGMVGTAVTFFHIAIVDFNFFLKKFLFLIFELFTTILVAVLLLSPFRFLLGSTKLMALAAFIAVVIHPPVRRGLQFAVEKILKKIGPTSSQITATREKIRESTYTYTELARNLVDLSLSTLPIESAAVYFYDISKQEYYLCAQRGMKSELAGNLRYNRSGLAVSTSDPLVIHFGATHDVLQMESLLNDLEDPRIQPLVASLHRLEAEICLPFIFGEKLRGFMVVGRKKDNTLYNNEETDLILSYAQMGTDVMRTVMAMETELNHVALYSHDMNHNIRSVTQTLQFLMSPMALSQPPEKLKNLIQQANTVAERLYTSFQMNQDRSALIMKSIRGEYDKKSLRLSNVVRASTEKFSLQAEKAGVAYKVEVDEASADFMGNESDLIRVLDNLISNALRHLPERDGSLQVHGRQLNGSYEIIVKDNGEGIAPEYLGQIWQVGWQGKEGKKGSSGYGLAIVKQIIQLHDGKIEASSGGAGTGVEFKITL